MEPPVTTQCSQPDRLGRVSVRAGTMAVVTGTFNRVPGRESRDWDLIAAGEVGLVVRD